MNDTTLFVQLLPYIGTLLTFLLSIFTLWSSRRNRNAEVENKKADTEHKKANTVNVISDTALELVAALNARVDQLEFQLKDRLIQVQDLEKRVDSLEQLLKTKDREIESLQKQRRAQTTKIDQLENHSIWRDNELLKAVERIELLEFERAELEGEVALLHEREDRRKQENIGLTSQFEELLEKLSKTEKERDALVEKVKFFKSEIDKRDKIILNLQDLIDNGS